MAQYVHVYIDNEEKNYRNKGLYGVIVFIGQQSKGGEKTLWQRSIQKR